MLLTSNSHLLKAFKSATLDKRFAIRNYLISIWQSHMHGGGEKYKQPELLCTLEHVT